MFCIRLSRLVTLSIQPLRRTSLCKRSSCTACVPKVAPRRAIRLWWCSHIRDAVDTAAWELSWRYIMCFEILCIPTKSKSWCLLLDSAIPSRSWFLSFGTWINELIDNASYCFDQSYRPQDLPSYIVNLRDQTLQDRDEKTQWVIKCFFPSRLWSETLELFFEAWRNAKTDKQYLWACPAGCIWLLPFEKICWSKPGTISLTLVGTSRILYHVSILGVKLKLHVFAQEMWPANLVRLSFPVSLMAESTFSL